MQESLCTKNLLHHTAIITNMITSVYKYLPKFIITKPSSLGHQQFQPRYKKSMLILWKHYLNFKYYKFVIFKFNQHTLRFDLDLERLERDFLLESDPRLRCDLDLDLDRFFLDGLSVDFLLLLLSFLLVLLSGSSSLTSSLSSSLVGDGEAEPDLLLWEDLEEWEEWEDDLALGGISSSCQWQTELKISRILFHIAWKYTCTSEKNVYTEPVTCI
jgi:hypothetical protein